MKFLLGLGYAACAISAVCLTGIIMGSGGAGWIQALALAGSYLFVGALAACVWVMGRMD